MNYIISVTMVNVGTNEEVVLVTKRGKIRCHFNEWFSYKNYEIQLRFDYNGKSDEPPMLDADVRNTTTSELIKKGPWHHTEAKHDTASNTNIYTFKFDDLELRLSIITDAATDQLFKVTVGKPRS